MKMMILVLLVAVLAVVPLKGHGHDDKDVKGHGHDHDDGHHDGHGPHHTPDPRCPSLGDCKCHPKGLGLLQHGQERHEGGGCGRSGPCKNGQICCRNACCERRSCVNPPSAGTTVASVTTK